MKAILSSLVLSLAIVVGVQAKTITGIVTDQADSKPIAGVEVRNGNLSFTTTGQDGKYIIEAEAGDELTFSFVGYNVSVIKVGKKSVVDIQLTATVYMLEEA